MNKFLLLALILLLGVLGFAMGLFSKDSSTALSQYVPKSVGDMFTKNKNKSSNKQNTVGSDSIAAIVIPESNTQQPFSTKQDGVKNNTLLKDTKQSDISTIEIPESLMAEMQQEITLQTDVTAKEVSNIKQELDKLEFENKALTEKLKTLNDESKERDGVLQDIERQIKEKLGSQDLQLNIPDNLLKDLEKQIQELNH